MFTEEDGQETSSPGGFELDSDIAKQLDAQYKQILDKKTGKRVPPSSKTKLYMYKT